MPKTEQLTTIAPPTPNGTPPKRRLLKRADILSTHDLISEEVPTDEWGENTAVRVRAMDFDTRDMWELAQVAFADDKTGECFRGMRAKIVARCVVDEKGERELTDADVLALGKQDAAPIKRAWLAIQRLSKLDQITEEIETEAKN